MIMDNTNTAPKWIGVTLVAAGTYNLLWGAAVVLFPTAIFRWTGMQLPRGRHRRRGIARLGLGLDLFLASTGSRQARRLVQRRFTPLACSIELGSHRGLDRTRFACLLDDRPDVAAREQRLGHRDSTTLISNISIDSS